MWLVSFFLASAAVVLLAGVSLKIWKMSIVWRERITSDFPIKPAVVLNKLSGGSKNLMQTSIYRQTLKQLTRFKLRLAMLLFKANMFQSTTMLFDNIYSICNMYLFWKIQWSFSIKSSGKWKAWKLPHTTLSKSFESLLWSGLHKQLKSCFMFISFYFVVFMLLFNKI